MVGALDDAVDKLGAVGRFGLPHLVLLGFVVRPVSDWLCGIDSDTRPFLPHPRGATLRVNLEEIDGLGGREECRSVGEVSELAILE